jgi:hypothetical protein
MPDVPSPNADCMSKSNRRAGSQVPAISSPRVLMVATMHWPITSRLCLAMARAGITIAAVTPKHHHVGELGAVAAEFTYTRRDPMRTTLGAISAWRPDLVVPCDEPAVVLLHLLQNELINAPGGRPCESIALMRRSLGEPTSFGIVCHRSELMAFAKSEGIAVPDTAVVSNRHELHGLLDKAQYPKVLKVDGSWGGLGIRIVSDAAEADRSFVELTCQSNWRMAAKKSVKELTIKPLRRHLTSAMPAITLQQYIQGRSANRALFCQEGRVLAGLSVEAVRTLTETGPATVVRIIEHPEITETAAHLVSRLGLSGFIGFDFILEETTNRAILIELNARPTSICHLVPSDDRDLIGALAIELSGFPRRGLTSLIKDPLIALFPQELWRDPQSPYLHSAYHDVPWEEPQFVGAYLTPTRQEGKNWVDGVRAGVGIAHRWFRGAPGGHRALPQLRRPVETDHPLSSK